MRKLFGFVVVAAVLVASFATSAWAVSASDVKFEYKQVKWASYTNPTGSQAIVTLRDTTFIEAEDAADTSEVISLADVAWDFQANSTTQYVCGAIMVTANVTNQVTDSLYWALQFQTPDGNWGPLSYGMPSGTTASAYNSLIGLSSVATSYAWKGVIGCDSDAVLGSGALQNIYLGLPFRVIVYGDVSGTTPKLSGCKLWVSMPRRSDAN